MTGPVGDDDFGDVADVYAAVVGGYADEVEEEDQEAGPGNPRPVPPPVPGQDPAGRASARLLRRRWDELRVLCEYLDWAAAAHDGYAPGLQQNTASLRQLIEGTDDGLPEEIIKARGLVSVLALVGDSLLGHLGFDPTTVQDGCVGAWTFTAEPSEASRQAFAAACEVLARTAGNGGCDFGETAWQACLEEATGLLMDALDEVTEEEHGTEHTGWAGAVSAGAEELLAFAYPVSGIRDQCVATLARARDLEGQFLTAWESEDRGAASAAAAQAERTGWQGRLKRSADTPAAARARGRVHASRAPEGSPYAAGADPLDQYAAAERGRLWDKEFVERPDGFVTYVPRDGELQEFRERFLAKLVPGVQPETGRQGESEEVPQAPMQRLSLEGQTLAGRTRAFVIYNDQVFLFKVGSCMIRDGNGKATYHETMTEAYKDSDRDQQKLGKQRTSTLEIIHHSSMAQGHDVVTAGELDFDANGMIRGVRDKSGHYRPDAGAMSQGAQWLLGNRLITPATRIRLTGGKNKDKGAPVAKEWVHQRTKDGSYTGDDLVLRTDQLRQSPDEHQHRLHRTLAGQIRYHFYIDVKSNSADGIAEFGPLDLEGEEAVDLLVDTCHVYESRDEAEEFLMGGRSTHSYLARKKLDVHIRLGPKWVKETNWNAAVARQNGTGGTVHRFADKFDLPSKGTPSQMLVHRIGKTLGLLT